MRTPHKYLIPHRSFLAGWQLTLLVAASSAGAAGCLWAAWREFPAHAWNDIRLAPAFALRHGINPYPPLGGGPLSTWIYGPVGILVNLPATFASSATAALHSAFFINIITLLGPLAFILYKSKELRARGRMTAVLALATAVFFVPRPNFVFQVADHAAVAFGLLSCWCLTRHRSPTGGWVTLGAAFCAAAVWSKQIALFLVLGQATYLLLASNRATTVRYLTWVAVFGFSALGLFAMTFGFENLWLNLVVIPGKLPWADIGPRLLLRPLTLVAQILIPTFGLWLLWNRGYWPTRERESGRFFQIATLVAAAMLPVGVAAFLKVGGDTNVLHSWDYLLPAALLLGLVRNQGSGSALRVAVVVTVGLLLRREDLLRLQLQPFTNHYAVADALIATQPGRVWFPQNPVITFFADRRLWSVEDGVATRHLAQYGIREADFRRHLPAEMQAVVYPNTVVNPFAMALLPDFARVDRIPYWIVYSRETPALPRISPP